MFSFGGKEYCKHERRGTPHVSGSTGGQEGFTNTLTTLRLREWCRMQYPSYWDTIGIGLKN